MARELPPAINLSENAIERIRAIMAADPQAVGLRVAVVSSGCSGLRYKIDLAKEPSKDDLVVEQGGVKVFLEPSSQLYLIGSTLDYVTRGLNSAFEFNNPNATASCGCGESFSVK